jgi:hypothetical protein
METVTVIHMDTETLVRFTGVTTAVTTVALHTMWIATRSRNSQSIETQDPAATGKRMSIDLLNCFLIATYVAKI